MDKKISTNKLAKSNKAKVTNSRDSQARKVMAVNNSLKIEVMKGKSNG